MRVELIHVLEDAESRVRSLLEAAVAKSDYDAVELLAETARWLSDKARHLQRDGSLSPSTDDESRARPADDSNLPPLTTMTRYPVFFREGDRLVKAGLSRGSASTYEHKAGKSVLDAIVARIVDASGKKKVFVIDDLVGIRLEGSSSAVPSYQVYLCIAWLKEVGILRDVGRRRYEIITLSPNLNAQVDKEWKRIKVRNFEGSQQ